MISLRRLLPTLFPYLSRSIVILFGIFAAHTVCAQFTTTMHSPPMAIADRETIGSLTQLNVYRGGSVGNFFQAGTLNRQNVLVEVNVFGGTVGNQFSAHAGSRINVRGGSIGNQFQAGNGSLVKISGGTVGTDFRAATGSRVEISGGTLGSGFAASEGSLILLTGGQLGSRILTRRDSNLVMSGGELLAAAQIAGSATISGGSVGPQFTLKSGGELNLVGGNIANGFFAAAGSTLHLIGREFFLGNDSLDEMSLGTTRLLGERDQELSMRLVDGSSFQLHLGGLAADGNTLHSEAAVKITRVVPLAGDYNGNGVVDQNDLDLVLLNWGQEILSPTDRGWLQDLPQGAIDRQELDQVLLGWGTRFSASQVNAIPEPPTIGIVGSALVLLAIGCRQRRAYCRRATA